MILDDLKDLIKEMEDVLIKDPRFREEADFKNQVKVIYNCEKVKSFVQMPTYDVTHIVMSNLQYLGNNIKNKKETKKETKHECKCPTCEKLKIDGVDVNIEDLMLLIEELLRRVHEAHEAAGKIITGPLSLDEIRDLSKKGKFKEAMDALSKIH